jgi:hypothetical protein
MNPVDQLSVMVLLVILFLGISLGMIGCAVHGSIREDRKRSLLKAAPDAVCAGARVLNGVYTADDGYLQYLLSWSGMSRWRSGRQAPHGPYGKRANDD